MSDRNFEIKKGLNVRNGKLVADESGVFVDGVAVATVNYVDSTENTLQSNIDAEEASRISIDNTLQTSIDNINNGTAKVSIVLDGITAPYTSDYSTFVNRLVIPNDVDEVYVDTSLMELSFHLDIPITRTKPLRIYNTTQDVVVYIYADGVSQRWLSDLNTMTSPDGYRCIESYAKNETFIISKVTINGVESFSVISSNPRYNSVSGLFIYGGGGKETPPYTSDVFIGYNAGYYNTTGSYNAFIGQRAGYSNTTGGNNTFIGQNAGFSNTIGQNHIFIGQNAGYNFIGVGDGAVVATNTALGYRAMFYNVDGSGNFVAGYEAGLGATGNSYYNNTFIGYRAGRSNTTGNYNTFIGYTAGGGNSTGQNNVCIGYIAGGNNTIGTNNTCIGYQAGNTITTGDYNIILGYDADASADNQDGVAIGRSTLVRHSNSVVFGVGTQSDDANTFKIGNATTGMDLNVVGQITSSLTTGDLFNVSVTNDAASLTDGGLFFGNATDAGNECYLMQLQWQSLDRFTITESGYVIVNGIIAVGATEACQIIPDQNDSSLAVAYRFDTLNDLVTAGAKIASFLNDGTEVVAITKDGLDVVGQITGSEAWIVQTGMTNVVGDNWTAVANKKYMVDTTNRATNVTMTMPVTTSIPIGTTVTVTDMKGLFAVGGTANVVTDDALELFNGVAGTWEFDVTNSTVVCVWTGATYGWKTIITQP